MRSTLKHAVATVVLVLSFAAPVAGGQFEDGVAAYEAGDYATAYRLQRPLADEGLAKAQVNIGIMYAHGHGVPRNEADAARWFRKAADQGDAFAQHNLGVFYDTGHGVPQNKAEAVRWFRKAADQGLADAQYDLGNMYAEGHGVPQDNIRAYVWFSLSAAQGDRRAVQSRGILARGMTLAEVAEAENLARQWGPMKQPPQ